MIDKDIKPKYFVGVFASIENYSVLQKKLNRYFEGRWIKEKKLHMNFKYLGEVEDIEKVIKKLSKLNYNKKQVVTFRRLKVFGKKVLNFRSSNKTIYKIQNSIDSLLKKDFPKDQNFKPHITIMGINKIKDKNYKVKLKECSFEAKVELKISLIKSIPTQNGMKYKIIRTF